MIPALAISTKSLALTPWSASVKPVVFPSISDVTSKVPFVEPATTTVPFTEKQALEQATKEKNAETLKEAKLKFIRNLRDKKLEETDYMANSDYVMEEKYKTWRQSLRDLPQDNTTEAEYDILLAKDDNEKLTHSIWKQPTS